MESGNLNHPETPEELARQLLTCLKREEEALRTAEEAEILAVARDKDDLLARLSAWQARSEGALQGEGSVAQAIPEGLRRRLAAQAARNRALLQAALEAIQDFLHLLMPSGPGTYEAEGRLRPGAGGSLVHRQV
ncbi:MAG: hypothetical protein WHT07_04020 [Desulfobaccales bacterium]